MSPNLAHEVILEETRYSGQVLAARRTSDWPTG